ncbi:GDP-D-mannose dehydratase [Bradyrhizobium sp. USDA 4532]|nr:GDP-D-mannose dehydratase [Bradyrhizobium sp. USDA 4545]MCP1916577.1 GDP-D-mannose dehydratase [Bradyrhizobium sp. USDA 4532]
MPTRSACCSCWRRYSSSAWKRKRNSIRILQVDESGDYVLAISETRSVREFVELAFAEAGRSSRGQSFGRRQRRGLGNGTPRREFLYVDDLADACIHLMKTTYSSPELVNIGTGEDITIAEFARVVAAAVGYRGEISFDTSRPDGTPRQAARRRPAGEARLGATTTSLEDGIALAYQAYLRETK